MMVGNGKGCHGHILDFPLVDVTPASNVMLIPFSVLKMVLPPYSNTEIALK